MTRQQRVPCFLDGQALKSLDEGARKIEGKISPEDDVQDDAGAMYGVKGAEVENQD